jgi:ABC-type phosphate/phosphonate transport system substrate-binding protein
MSRIWLVGVAVVFGLMSPLAAQAQGTVRVGLPDSLVKELSPGKQALVDSEFRDLVEEFTGLKADVFQGGSGLEAAQKLEAKEWDLAVLQGVEMAWLKDKHPTIRPLMIAANVPREIHAVVVVKKDGGPASSAELKGKPVQMYKGKLHIRLFAEKQAGGDPKAFFGKFTETGSAESALDAVLTGAAQAALVDNVALESYKKIHPGRHARLKALAQSEMFPSVAVAYKEGALSQEIQQAFVAGMLKANKSDKGREAMANFRIATFEPVPSDYADMLGATMKAYPPKK